MSLPWYKWFASDWLLSETRFSLSLAERGMYRDLLDIHYLEGSIPKNPLVLASLLSTPESEFSAAWKNVSKCFFEHPERPERLLNRRALSEFKNLAKYHEKQRLNGSKGGRPRKENPTENPPVKPKKARARASEPDIDTPPSPLNGGGGGDEKEPVGLTPEETQFAWSKICEAYPNDKGQHNAERYFVEQLAMELDPRALADRIYRSAKIIARWPPERQRFDVPSLRDFIHDKRYLEDWKARYSEATRTKMAWED